MSTSQARTGRHLRRRGLTALLALATVAALLLGTGLPAADAGSGDATFSPHAARGIDAACVGAEGFDPGFADTTGLAPSTQEAIACLAFYEITAGTTPTTYGPSARVQRVDMAVFLARLLDHAAATSDGLTLPTPEAQGFTDVAGLSTERRNAVNLLGTLGVTGGTGDGSTFSPFESVTRRDMASFLVRVQDLLEEGSYDTSESFFSDVPDDLARSEDINALAAQGIVQGGVDGSYGPFAPVLRSQMALFIMRHVDENVTAGRIAAATGDGPPAGTEVCFDEPELGTTRDGANNPIAEPRADVSDICVTYDADELLLRTKVDDPTDPLTDPSWAIIPDGAPDTPVTGVLHTLTTSGEPFADPTHSVQFRQITFEGETELEAQIFDVTTEPDTRVCLDEASAEFNDGWYDVRVDDPSCLEAAGAPETLQLSTFMVYRFGTDVQDYAFDRWPGPDGYLGPVTLGDTPTGTSAACVDAPAGTTQDGSTEGAPNDVPQADIVEVCASYGADEIELRTRVAEPTDPLSDENWTEDWGVQAPPGLRYELSTTGAPVHPDPEWTVVYEPRRVHPDEDYWIEADVVEFVEDDLDEIRCTDADTDAAFEDGWYVVSFAPSCLGDPASFELSAQMTYRFDTGFTGVGFDVQPQGLGETFDPIVRP